MKNESTFKMKLRIIKMATHDLFSIMPALTCYLILLRIVKSLVTVFQVSVIANLIDSAGQIVTGTTNSYHFLSYAGQLIVCYILTQICNILEYKINNIDIIPKMEVFHHKLSTHLTEISLEATNIPEIQNMFWRAKDAIYQDRISSVFFSVFSVVPILLQLIGIAVVLARYNIVLVLVAFLSVFPSAAVLFFLGKKEYMFDKSQTVNRRRAEYLWSILSKKEAIREGRIFGFREYLKNKYLSVHQENFEARKQIMLKNQMSIFAAECIKYFFYGVAVVYSVKLIVEEKISIGSFGACLTIFSSMQGMAYHLFSYISIINSACNYASDYYDFFTLEKEDKGKMNISGNFNTLRFSNVSFAYPQQNRNAVDHVSFEVKQGQIVVVVGENGSGKTTLSKLLLGLYKPQTGSIYYNQKDIINFNKKSYYKIFSMAIQDFGRYALTLNENIAFSDIGKLNDIERINMIIEQSEIENVIKKLGGGDTELGIEFGDAELSGGEWQKVALARAMFRRSQFILLDEPTSSIDPIFESELLNRFISVSKEKTSVIISHRVGICRKADVILVMDHGRLVEHGSHEKLLHNKGKYYELWTAQAKWYQS